MNELKPCPFCGAKAEIFLHGFYSEKTQDFNDKTYGVICDSCGSQGYQFYETEQQAIDAWNRRKDDSK